MVVFLEYLVDVVLKKMSKWCFIVLNPPVEECVTSESSANIDKKPITLNHVHY